VAGATRDARRQAPRLGLLVLAAACAAAQEPPGGPPDFTPPTLTGVRPDSGAVLPGYRGAAEFAFDEVISERSAQRLDDLFMISPRPERVSVSWKRTRLDVRPAGGWRPNAVYRVTLLPGVMDLRNNRMRTGGDLVFSTGGPIPETRVAGTVVDWAKGQIGAGALVEAIGPDSAVYFTKADSAGDFVLRAIPPGSYALIATADENNNRRRDRREAFDSVPLTVDTTAADSTPRELWAFVHDTVGPPLRTVTQVDSTTVRLEFGQQLRPDAPPSDAVTAWQLPDTTPVAVAAVWTPSVYDSVRRAEAPRDTTRAPGDTTAGRDTTGAPAAARDTAARVPPRGAPPRRPGQIEAKPVAADTGRAAQLLKQRPALFDTWTVRLATVLAPGGRYLFEARATNVSGVTNAARAVLAVPDSTAAAARRP
jgi:hypothetical protein